MDHDDRLDDKLLRRFIQIYDGPFWIARPLIDFSTSSMLATVAAQALWGDHPL